MAWTVLEDILFKVWNFGTFLGEKSNQFEDVQDPLQLPTMGSSENDSAQWIFVNKLKFYGYQSVTEVL